MANPYLPKLGPTVGGGLPGIPRRKEGAPVRGEAIFPVGTYQFVVPDNVQRLAIVCLAGGGGGASGTTFDTSGGGGGALSWANSVSVTPGEVLNVIAADGGPSIPSFVSSRTSNGGNSHVKRGAVSLCEAGGGEGGNTGANQGTNLGGVVIVGDGGGSGGNGRVNIIGTNHGQGGGGAGGYTGSGGNSSVGDNNNLGADGQGGGGGGGANSTTLNASQAGGVGLFGQGSNGVSTIYSANNNAANGSGYLSANDGVGSDGVNRLFISQATAQYLCAPANQGAGGAAQASNSTQFNAQPGGNGAVRIIWGEGREFPSTDVGQS